MRKIADAAELESELRQLLAYTQSEEHPSRSHIAAELERLSERLASTDHEAGVVDSRSEALKFFESATKTWAHGSYQANDRVGWVQWGGLGRIEFNESNNDSAVVVTVPQIRMKARADQVLKALRAISKITGNTSL